MPITTKDISEALKTMTNNTAPGPSRVNYHLLAWAHTTQPQLLVDIFNTSIDTGIHLWKEVTIIVLNKPN